MVESRSCLLIGIARESDVRDCLSIEIVYNCFRRLAINWFCSDNYLGGLSISWNRRSNWFLLLSNSWNCPHKRCLSLFINLNCPDKWFQKLSINWNCLNNWCLVLLINWNCPGKWSRRRAIKWNCPEDCSHRLLINWKCQNNWCLVLSVIGIGQTNDLGDYWLELSWKLFWQAVLIGIAWTIGFGWCKQIEVVEAAVGTTAFRDRPLFGIIQTIDF